MEFILKNEDHTIGNLLQQQLANNEEVVFAGYIMPHPLEKSIKLKIETVTPGNEVDILKTTIYDIIKQLDQIKESFIKNQKDTNKLN